MYLWNRTSPCQARQVCHKMPGLIWMVKGPVEKCSPSSHQCSPGDPFVQHSASTAGGQTKKTTAPNTEGHSLDSRAVADNRAFSLRK